MTPDERVQALSRFGFTERQARFLATVMRFGGVCVPRQYARFAGTAYGRRVNAFFDTLAERGFAIKCRCLHNRAALYHVHHRPLYEAIGEGSSRWRRPVPAGRAIERVIRLDAVLSLPEISWFATEREKLDFVAATGSGLPQEHLPHVAVGCRVRLFPDEVMIGMGEGRAVLLYVVLGVSELDVRAVLQRYADLLAVLPRWTLRMVFPKATAPVTERFQSLVGEELATPLDPATVGELRRYFERVRHATEPGKGNPDLPAWRPWDPFAGDRFRVLYRRWLGDGDSALSVVSSNGIVDHLANQTGCVKYDVLPRSYQHLSPLASPSRLPTERVIDGQQLDGDTQLPRPRPTREEEPESIRDQLARDWYRLVDAHRAQKKLEPSR